MRAWGVHTRSWGDFTGTDDSACTGAPGVTSTQKRTQDVSDCSKLDLGPQAGLL